MSAKAKKPSPKPKPKPTKPGKIIEGIPEKKQFPSPLIPKIPPKKKK